jgi:uncharacterized membrane protein
MDDRDTTIEGMIVHFNAAEKPDNWVSKPVGSLLLPVLIMIVTWVVTFSMKLEKNRNKRRRAEAVIGSILAAASGALFTVHVFIIAYSLGYKLSVAAFASIIVGMIFVIMGNLLPRLPQGTMQWPRISDDKYRKASRLQGRCMMLTLFFVMLVAFIVVLIGILMYYCRIR